MPGRRPGSAKGAPPPPPQVFRLPVFGCASAPASRSGTFTSMVAGRSMEISTRVPVLHRDDLVIDPEIAARQQELDPRAQAGSEPDLGCARRATARQTALNFPRFYTIEGLTSQWGRLFLTPLLPHCLVAQW
jgi:hypothetical protein